MEWIELLVGAALGQILPIGYKKYQENSLSRELQSRRKAFATDKISEWLIKYYEKNHHLNDLYKCRIGNFERSIPFITCAEWQKVSDVMQNSDRILEYVESEEHKFHINQKLLAKRQRLGQKLFNDPILYLDYIKDINGSVQLHVKKCDFFETMTYLVELEEETYKAYRKRSFKNLKVRDTYLDSLATVKQIRNRPSNVGCITALIIKAGTSYELLVNTRSYSTVTYGGAKALTPQFGLIPVEGAQNEKLSLVFYNFVKEYCEELFSYDELIKKSDVKSTDPTWFYRLAEASELLKLQEDNKFTLSFLGFGFDALNGGALLGLLALVEDEDFGGRLKSRIMANWEQEEIEFVDITDRRLEEWLRSNRYQFGSAFVISRALQELKKRQKVEKEQC